MFDPDTLAKLATAHKDTLTLVCGIEDLLNSRFFDMREAVHCVMLAAMTGESMVMIGPPGTAKSRLIRSFCNVINLLDNEALAPPADHQPGLETVHEKYFEYLLTQFTEPSELFGYFDLPRLFHPTKPDQVRNDVNMMQRAQVVFLDEVFNASSAILNALLTFMNERKFHDRGQRVQTPLRLLFSATNHTPRDEGLAAVYDRFLLRCRLDNVPAKPERMAAMLDRAWTETHAAKLDHDSLAERGTLLARLDGFRADVDHLSAQGALKINADDPAFAMLADLAAELRRKELSALSNRRLVKFSAVFMAEALLRSCRDGSFRPVIGAADLMPLLRYGLDEEDPGTVYKLAQHLGTAG